MPLPEPTKPLPFPPPRHTGLPLVAPDFAEQELGDAIDNIIPSFGYEMVPMVGIGGSAGAVTTLQRFFESVPEDTGMVFVVVLHLAPDRPSSLAELIGRWTKMTVVQGEDGSKTHPNHVYVIPPGKHLIATNGHLRLTDLDREQGRHIAVDLFFRSLADTHGPHAIAIVLSGADRDGAVGIKRIKERGGLTIAQDPEEAEFNSMPQAAISTGMVDWVLPTADMARRAMEYIKRGKAIKLPPEEGPQPTSATRSGMNEAEATFVEILVFLRMRTGRDFSYYKRATILRRLSRRMQVNGVSDMLGYLAFLRTHPGEAEGLLNELLISVTNFFRDRDAFAEMEKLIPRLFEGKTQGDTIRIWVPACATGEEAYSFGMLLIEHARKLEAPPAMQVFACDLDEEAVQLARRGLFPDSIAADVSQERLRQFFVKEHRGYRVRRELREMVLFAAHDLLKDAPFSKNDVISCRNLLIYLNREAQARVTDIFHFGLKEAGYLFLGTSETIEDGSPLFRVIDKKARIFQRKTGLRTGLPVSNGPGTLLIRQIERQVAAIVGEQNDPKSLLPPATVLRSHSLAPTGLRKTLPAVADRLPWGEMHFKLIERFSPPSALVNKEYDIQHLSESCGRFLQFLGGEPTTNLLRLAHPSLKAELRSTLFRAIQSAKPAESLGVPIELDGAQKMVNIRAIPANDLAPDHLLVSFEILGPDAETGNPSNPPAPNEPILPHLERQVELLRTNLRDTVEQYEASTEELKASNEELHAMNEELRSATEELETSREELQSINEELSTVNSELKSKVEELGQANGDLNNLMGATAIATVFLDRNMQVMRFTQSAAPIFNLIASDIGRPLSHLQHRVDYPQMAADAERVLHTLSPIEREVTGAGDRCFIARMLPYRTVDDRIAGVVLTFVDITERQRSLEELTRFNKAAVGRENRMIDLKKEVNELLYRLGEPRRYSLDFLKEEAGKPQ